MSAYRAPAPRHLCDPPIARGYDALPAGPLGSCWRCPSCQRLWRVGGYQEERGGRIVLDARRWTRAGWLTRWRLRRGQLWEITVLDETGASQ